MTKAQRLKKEAREAATWREHRLGHFAPAHPGSTSYLTTCGVCGMLVVIDTAPPPNGIDIGGAAVAINCPGRDAMTRA